ncbi:uncharacterized protein LOC126900318 [Daktulosphaira vitifoliae]|uniref:uncharacterized protein LOC126900318 n=1 Tax=Daktulosphaira vitifoliae TaxID=58002 RepID=UPI0021AB04C6|nr:uncharacterized protein LOC126900318 [Daktulosphaira vitifoliae]
MEHINKSDDEVKHLNISKIQIILEEILYKLSDYHKNSINDYGSIHNDMEPINKSYNGVEHLNITDTQIIAEEITHTQSDHHENSNNDYVSKRNDVENHSYKSDEDVKHSNIIENSINDNDGKHDDVNISSSKFFGKGYRYIGLNVFFRLKIR